MTVYMPILPIGMLDLFEECDCNNAFILPQFWHIGEYRSFYCTRTWEKVVIDNAMYENPEAVGIDVLIDIANEVNSLKTYIVGPESIGDGINTTRKVLQAIAKYGPRGDNWHMMAVFQGSPNEMFHLYDNLKEYDMGFAIPVSMYRAGWSRAGLKYFTGIRNHYVHALGIDDLTEIPDLVRAGIDSFDSSIVATAAVNNIDLLGERLRIIRSGSPDDPRRVDLECTEFDTDVRDATACNVEDIVSLIGSIRIEAKGV